MRSDIAAVAETLGCIVAQDEYFVENVMGTDVHLIPFSRTVLLGNFCFT